MLGRRLASRSWDIEEGKVALRLSGEAAVGGALTCVFIRGAVTSPVDGLKRVAASAEIGVSAILRLRFSALYRCCRLLYAFIDGAILALVISGCCTISKEPSVQL